MDEGKERATLAKAERARKFLESEEWKEAWRLYRERALSVIENAKSNDSETIMHAKRLLTAAAAAKTHMEALMVDGQVAAKTLEMHEKKPLLKRVFG
jgi:hypothetical protein